MWGPVPRHELVFVLLLLVGSCQLPATAAAVPVWSREGRLAAQARHENVRSASYPGRSSNSSKVPSQLIPSATHGVLHRWWYLRSVAGHTPWGSSHERFQTQNLQQLEQNNARDSSLLTPSRQHGMAYSFSRQQTSSHCRQQASIPQIFDKPQHQLWVYAGTPVAEVASAPAATAVISTEQAVVGRNDASRQGSSAAELAAAGLAAAGVAVSKGSQQAHIPLDTAVPLVLKSQACSVPRKLLLKHTMCGGGAPKQQQQQQRQQQQQWRRRGRLLLLWRRRLLDLDLRKIDADRDIARLKLIQSGDANLRLSYVKYALYYLLTCGGTTGSQDVAAAAAAFRAVPDSNPKYAATPGLVELRLQLLQEVLPRAERDGRRNSEECDWYYNTLAPVVSPAFTLNSSTASASPTASSPSPSPSPSPGNETAPESSPGPDADVVIPVRKPANSTSGLPPPSGVVTGAVSGGNSSGAVVGK